ncbi:MAG: 30S ribosomal protein S6--L-glutamate ligase, partial [Thermomicrobiales bacterium]|nr:30S ribosomal protein S6--L-glutamate ligase [Thermomicrobiales bacterium]
MSEQLVVGILLSRVRVEEKLLIGELEARGVEIARIDDRELVLDLSRPDPALLRCDVVLERAINHLRALYTLKILNDWGVPTVNTYEVANI